MSTLSRPTTPTTAGRRMPDRDHYHERPEKGRIEVTPSLLNRIRFQKGKPDLDLSLCSLGPKIPLDCIKEHHGDQLTNLILSYNKIRSLPSNFVAEMSCLQSLELSHNELKKLPDNFGELENLVYLDISQNKLQKLPLSMGKMSRLQYLNIHENPFRPPLGAFLDLEKRNSTDGQMAATFTAQTVVNFLAKLAKETLIIGSGDHPLPVRRRGVTFENDSLDPDAEVDEEEETKWQRQYQRELELEAAEEDATNNNSVYDDTYFGGNLRRDELCVDAEMAGGHHLLQMVDYNRTPLSSPPEQKQRESFFDQFRIKNSRNDTVFPIPLVGKASSFILAHRQLKAKKDWNLRQLAGLLLSILLVLILPLVMATFFETSAVKKYAKGYSFSNSYWPSVKPVYEAVEYVISCVTSRPFLIRGPQPRPADNLNPFMAMVMALKDSLASLWKIMTGMFKSGAGKTIV